MFGHILNYENQFFVNGQEVIGIENVDISYSNSANISKVLGYSKGFTTVGQAPSQSVSITRNLICVDPLFSYVSGSNFSGSLNYSNNNYGFRSGYVQEYLVNCAVGSVPKVSANIVVYDEMVTGSKNASGSTSPPATYIPNQGSISITCDNVTTNRVIGFDYSIKTTRQPVYSIGSKLPAEVLTMNPIEYSASVQIDVDDAFLSSGLYFLNNRQNKSLSFTIRGRTGNVLLDMPIPKASLVSESLSSTADGGVKLTLNYIGHQ